MTRDLGRDDPRGWDLKSSRPWREKSPSLEKVIKKKMPGISRCISLKKNGWCSSVRWLFWGAVGAWTIQISWTCLSNWIISPKTNLGWKMTRVWNTNNLVSHKALIRKVNKELFRFILTPYHPYIPPSIELTWVLNNFLKWIWNKDAGLKVSGGYRAERCIGAHI